MPDSLVQRGPRALNFSSLFQHPVSTVLSARILTYPRNVLDPAPDSFTQGNSYVAEAEDPAADSANHVNLNPTQFEGLTEATKTVGEAVSEQVSQAFRSGRSALESIWEHRSKRISEQGGGDKLFSTLAVKQYNNGMKRKANEALQSGATLL